MDRYEYNVKSDQIKKLYAKKDYETAAEIADSIDWSRVKSNAMLTMVADSYEGSKQYDKARDVLTIAYERSPLGRQLAYRLTILSLRMKDFVAADEYYQDFVEMAPRDVAQYILKYRISRAKGESVDVLIQILEAYVDVEMDERWQYELAKLYHEAGEKDKCISMCDKIILWFSEGKYVTKAMELKMKYEPLTEEQQAKYDGKWDYYNEKIKAEEKEESAEEDSDKDSETEDTDKSEAADEDDEYDEATVSEEEEDTQTEEISDNTEAETSDDNDSADNTADDVVKEEKPWEHMNDILNDTTALDYLTDYSEEEKVEPEPEEPQVDDETAQAVEEQLAKMIEVSMQDAKNEIEATSDSEESENEEDEEKDVSESEEDTVEDVSGNEEDSEIEEIFSEEAEENDENEEDTPEDAVIKPLLADDEEDIDEMDDTELVAKTLTEEDDEEDGQEEDDDEMTEEEDIEEEVSETEEKVMEDQAEEDDYLEDETYDDEEAKEDEAVMNEEDTADENEEATSVSDEEITDESEDVLKQPGSDNKIEIFEFDSDKEGKVRNIGEELTKTAEIDIDEINIKVQQSGENIYDTANIQEALAQSMKLIMRAENEQATRNAFVQSDAMDEPTKRIDKDIMDSAESVQEDEEKEPSKPIYETVPLQPIYDKDEDGQIYLSEPTVQDEQVEGQMNIEDVLSEFEKRKREALEEAARKEVIAREAAKRAAEEAAAAREAVARAIAEEAAARAALEKAASDQEALRLSEITPDEVLEDIPAMKEVQQTANIPVNQIIGNTLNDLSNVVKAMEEQTISGEEAAKQILEAPNEEMPEQNLDMVQEEMPGQDIESSQETAVTATESQDDTEGHDDLESQEQQTQTSADEQQEEAGTDAQADDEGYELSEDNKKLFVDFLEVPGLESQIAKTVDELVNNFVKDGTSRTNNVIVMGDAKTGKTTLALGLIKAANKGRERNGRKVAKVKATALNKKGITAAMSQILGTDLIVEQAGNLMPGTVVDFMAAMKLYTEEMIIVLEDDKAAMDRLVEANPVLKDMFNNQIYIKEFEINDLVRVAKEYAETKKYVVDEMGTLALYAKIDDISGKNQGITRAEIYEIIDAAITHAERFKISRFIGKIKRTHYEMGVLREEDFEKI